MISAKRHEAQSPAPPGGVTAMNDPITAQIADEVAGRHPAIRFSQEVTRSGELFLKIDFF